MAIDPVDLLLAYLDRRKLSQADFARISGITQGQISRILRRERRPDLDTAHTIEDVTKGKVPASAWRRPKASEKAA